MRYGVRCVLVARTKGALEEIDDIAIARGYVRPVMAPADLTMQNTVEELGASLFQRFGKLDLLVGNAALLGPVSPLAHIDVADWEKIFALNVTANFRLVRSLEALLLIAGGKACFFSCIDAQASPPFRAALSASKAALDSMIRSWRAETRRKSVSVHIVEPGIVATRFRQQAFPGESQKNLAKPEKIAENFIKHWQAGNPEAKWYLQ